MDTESRHPTNVVTDSRPPEPAPDEPGPFDRGVYRRLADEGHRFQFSQVMRLLEQAFPDAAAPGETMPLSDPPVRLRPSVDLVFPATDVKTVRPAEGGASRVEVVLTFLGLYGIDSPLPYYFYEALAHETRDTTPHRDFLDIFNHRVYAFFYRAWKKYRPHLHYEPGGEDRQSRRFVALSGLGTPSATEDLDLSPMQLAAQAGTLGARVRNADGLEALLTAFLGGVEVTVVENVPRWVEIPSRSGLGDGGLELGSTATIGETIYDRSSKFRIRLGPMGMDDYEDLLPGRPGAAVLQRLVALYAPDHLDYDVELQVASEELPATQLGEGGSRLGYTTSLGPPTDAVTSRVVDYE
jgi:type VI secretion system protein ImpH